MALLTATAALAEPAPSTPSRFAVTEGRLVVDHDSTTVAQRFEVIGKMTRTMTEASDHAPRFLIRSEVVPEVCSPTIFQNGFEGI